MRITRGQLRRIIQEAARLREAGLTRGAAEAALAKEPFSYEGKIMRIDNIIRGVDAALDQLESLADGAMSGAADAVGSLPELFDEMIELESGSDEGTDPELVAIREEAANVSQGVEDALDSVSTLVDSLKSLRSTLDGYYSSVETLADSESQRYVDPQEVLQAYLELSGGGSTSVTADQIAQMLGVSPKSIEWNGTTLRLMPDGTVEEMV